MTNARFVFCAVLAWAAVPLAASGQASAPAPESAASASSPAAPRTGPRLLTPAEKRDSATAPGDLRPERRVTPQISVPLGRRQPIESEAPGRARTRASPPAPNGVDDAVARCEAQRGEQVRAKCRDELARQAR